MKVFLIQPPPWGISPSIGLAQLGAFLKAAGHEVRAFDANLDFYRASGSSAGLVWEAGLQAGLNGAWSDRLWVADFLRSQAHLIETEYLRPIASAGKAVVGFSVTSCSLHSSLQLAEKIKASNPAALVVFGGQHFTVAPSDARRAIMSGHVDAVVVGDGEHTTAELVDLWRNGRALEKCRGIWLGRDGQAAFTGARKPVVLDKMPFADFSLFPPDRYDGYDGGSILLMTSRGCVRSCMFCGYRAPWAGLRTMGGARIHAEIEHQKKFFGRADSVYFYDLLINGNMPELSRLCELLISGRNKYLWRYCNAVVRPEMSAEFCRTMRRAGCSTVQLGLESGSQRVLDAMKKEQNVATMEAVLRDLHGAGIAVKTNFMFGFPGETEEDFQETLAFLRRNGRYIHRLYPSYTFTIMEPASPVGLRRDRFGIVGQGPDSEIFWESRDGSNDYLLRLGRYERFCALAESLGVGIDYGYDCSREVFRNYWLARYYRYRGDARAAEKHQSAYEAALRSAPYSEKRYAEQARTISEKGDARRSLELLQEASRANPGSAGIQVEMGRVLMSGGDFIGALRRFELAHSLDPAAESLAENMAAACNVLGLHGRALELLNAAAAGGAESIGLKVELGQAYWGLGRRQEALRAWEDGTRTFPGSASLYVCLGNAYNQCRMHAEAIACLEKARGLDERAKGLYANLGWALEGLGDLDEALKQLDRGLELTPRMASPIQFVKGRILKALGHELKAAACWQECLASTPRMPAVDLYYA